MSFSVTVDKDSEWATILAERLRSAGFEVWDPETELYPGDNFASKSVIVWLLTVSLFGERRCLGSDPGGGRSGWAAARADRRPNLGTGQGRTISYLHVPAGDFGSTLGGNPWTIQMRSSSSCL